jgi:hypothetical protein
MAAAAPPADTRNLPAAAPLAAADEAKGIAAPGAGVGGAVAAATPGRDKTAPAVPPPPSEPATRVQTSRQEKAPAPVAPSILPETIAPPQEPDRMRRTLAALESPAEPSAFVPGSAVGWRHARAGSVMRTLDGGATWAEQVLPGGVRLLALSAASPLVCWGAGASGAIVRTTDGATWQAVASPTGADLAWIAALDERRATVRTADGLTFDTGDGGATWRKR